nr:hypothetical protein [Tanacetum cinerariifolium]
NSAKKLNTYQAKYETFITFFDYPKRLLRVTLRTTTDEAFGRIKHDLGSFGEETNKTTDLNQHISRLCSQQVERASQLLCDAITTHATTTSPDSKMASDHDPTHYLEYSLPRRRHD